MGTLKTRTLADLYVVGELRSFKIDDESIDVWIQKLNPIDSQSVDRRAGAAKARYMLMTDDPESDEYLKCYSVVREYDDQENLIAIIIGDELRRARNRIVAQTASQPEWKEDDRLQGLYDAWHQGVGGDAPLQKIYHTRIDPETGEEYPTYPLAVKTFEAIGEYEKQVADAIDDAREDLEDRWRDAEPQELWEAATREFVKRQALQAYSDELARQRMFYCTYNPAPVMGEVDGERVQLTDTDGNLRWKAGSRYFATLADVDLLQEQTKQDLQLAIFMLEVDPLESKDSPATPASSNSSALPEMEETSPDSGRVEQGA